ncbi:MAG: Gx transporter family protein [Lachnospiraceae bacterium]|nr:Gx transporter family protein [Lachnospiraceae bacterium]
MGNKRTAYIGMLLALAFILSYVEHLLPISIGVPGVKIGLANMVVIVAMETVGKKEAFVLSMVRVLLMAFTFSNFSMMLYSVSGALLSYAVMYLLIKTEKFSYMGISAAGGVAHNLGQIIVAVFLLDSAGLLYYMPVLIITGTLSGIAIGLLSSVIISRVKRDT